MILFYDSTGKILHGQQGNVATIQYTGLTALQLDDSTYADVWNSLGEYTIQNGAPVHTPISDATKLADAQKAKTASLAASRDAACSTFTSAALGTSHTYLSGESDMVKLAGEYAYVKGSDYKNENIMWWTQENGRVSHTGAQFIQVYLDARTNEVNQYAHYDSLVSQVNAATTVSAVDAIIW